MYVVIPACLPHPHSTCGNCKEALCKNVFEGSEQLPSSPLMLQRWMLHRYVKSGGWDIFHPCPSLFFVLQMYLRSSHSSGSPSMLRCIQRERWRRWWLRRQSVRLPPNWTVRLTTQSSPWTSVGLQHLLQWDQHRQSEKNKIALYLTNI